tara:strand:+ start:540 stop:680 length:141 start_codon:yes stop_codon:yes gene_type:complete
MGFGMSLPGWEIRNQSRIAAPALLDCKPIEKSFGTQESEEAEAELL